MLKKFAVLILALGLQGITVAQAHQRLEEEKVVIPAKISNNEVTELYEYLYGVVRDPEFAHCLETPVDKFIEGRIRAKERGYGRTPVVPPTALVMPSDFEEDDSGGRFKGRRTTRNAEA
jgi:hypothetical protein